MCGRNAEPRMIPLGFTDEKIPEGRHICLIYQDDAERLRVVARYLASGLLADEKALCLVDGIAPDDLRAALAELGLDAARRDALETATAREVYCPSGAFDGDAVLARLARFYRTAVQDEGFAGARCSGEMNWGLDDAAAGLPALMEYEARLNRQAADTPFTACCQYDARRMDGATIMDVLSVHPMTIIRGQLVRNPDFVAPETFLREFRARGGGRSG